MKGRLPQDFDKIAQHPNFDKGQDAEEKNLQKIKDLMKSLKPRGIKGAELKTWNRVAFDLASANRLKSLYVDIVHQYCVVKARLDHLRDELDEEDWFYVTKGRHGTQMKSRPQVAQLNDDFRKFMQLTAHLGLSPATELRFNSQQGELFDDGFGDL